MSVAKARIRAGSSSWIATSLKDELAVVLAQTDEVTSDGTSIVFILDLDAHPEPNPTTLRQMFGLTVAETRLALQIARGNTPSEIARTRRLSRTTIRSQLASVFAKTQTGRQAELVALLARIAMLP
jgi:DNA-binding CsgD family transcriptional regulator